MTTVYRGKPSEGSKDDTSIRVGTKAYLQSIGLTVDEASGREVPNGDVDAKGRYVPPPGG